MISILIKIAIFSILLASYDVDAKSDSDMYIVSSSHPVFSMGEYLVTNRRSPVYFFEKDYIRKDTNVDVSFDKIELMSDSIIKALFHHKKIVREFLDDLCSGQTKEYVKFDPGLYTYIPETTDILHTKNDMIYIFPHSSAYYTAHLTTLWIFHNTIPGEGGSKREHRYYDRTITLNEIEYALYGVYSSSVRDYFVIGVDTDNFNRFIIFNHLFSPKFSSFEKIFYQLSQARAPIKRVKEIEALPSTYDWDYSIGLLEYARIQANSIVSTPSGYSSYHSIALIDYENGTFILEYQRSSHLRNARCITFDVDNTGQGHRFFYPGRLCNNDEIISRLLIRINPENRTVEFKIAKTEDISHLPECPSPEKD